MTLPKDSEILARTDAIVARCGRTPQAAIPILQALQTEFRHLPRVALRRVVETTDIPAAQLAGVSTFYAQFRHHGAGTIAIDPAGADIDQLG